VELLTGPSNKEFRQNPSIILKYKYLIKGLVLHHSDFICVAGPDESIFHWFLYFSHIQDNLPNCQVFARIDSEAWLFSFSHPAKEKLKAKQDKHREEINTKMDRSFKKTNLCLNSSRYISLLPSFFSLFSASCSTHSIHPSNLSSYTPSADTTSNSTGQIDL